MLNQTSREIGFDFTYTPFKDKSTLRNVEFVFGKNKWNWLNLEKYNLKVPKDYENLAGDAVFDIQLTQFENFKKMTEPIEAFT